MRHVNLACFSLLALATSACQSSHRVEKLREALDRAALPLRDSVAVAERSVPSGVAVSAALLVSADPVYSIAAVAEGRLSNVRVDIVSGQVLSNLQLGAVGASCPGSITLAEAITIAEARVSGEAVAIEADHDDACNREVQVLAGTTLWEVKVGPDGAVIEVEESDED